MKLVLSEDMSVDMLYRGKRVLGVVIFFGLAIFPTEALPYPCENLLHRIYDRGKAFAKEVKDTRGVRLILRSEKPEEPVGLWNGFRVEGKYTPLTGLNHLLIQEPVAKITSAVTGKRRVPTLLSGVTLWALLVTPPLTEGLDWATYQAQKYAVISKADGRKDQIDEFLKFDYRFHDIQSEQKKGHLTAEEARSQVELYLLGQDNYFNQGLREQIMDGTPWTKEKIQLALTLPIFSDVAGLITSGPKQSPLIETKTPPGPLPTEQAGAVIEIYDLLQIRYEVIAEFSKPDKSVYNSLRDGSFREIVNSFEKDPFTQEITSRVEQGRLSLPLAMYYLQKSAAFESQFAVYELLGIQVRSRKSPNKYATLSDVQSQMLKEIDQPRE